MRFYDIPENIFGSFLTSIQLDASRTSEGKQNMMANPALFIVSVLGFARGPTATKNHSFKDEGGREQE